MPLRPRMLLKPHRSTRSCNHPALFLLGMLCFLSGTTASATVFHLNYSSISKFVADNEGSHSFEIDGIPAFSETRWYVNSRFIETDEAGVLALDPRVTRTFGIATHKIEGRVYNSAGGHLKTLRWTFVSGPPDVVPDPIYAQPTLPLPGEPIFIQVGLHNIGGGIAEAGPLRDQEGYFYFNNTFVGEDNYDALKNTPGYAEYLASPIFSHHVPGTYTIRAVLDANNEVEESNENNNEIVATITIRGADWLPVPHVVGDSEQDARTKIIDAGFPAPSIRYVFHEEGPKGEVVSRSPDTLYLPPDETITLFVSIGPECLVSVVKPSPDQAWAIGSKKKIKWLMMGTCCEEVRLELWQNGEKVRTIKKATPNDGKFNWKIKPGKYSAGSDYKVRVFCDKHRNEFSQGKFSLVSR